VEGSDLIPTSLTRNASGKRGGWMNKEKRVYTTILGNCVRRVMVSYSQSSEKLNWRNGHVPGIMRTSGRGLSGETPNVEE
jgi:hypothetical protein